MLTRGRLVPRQPWAIKRTTRTELRGENIHYGGYISLKYWHSILLILSMKPYFLKKTQHLRRWISLRMLTQGRLVPRQPRAIKRTTPTALRRCNIRNDGFIHGNVGIIFTALYRCNIRNYGFIHGNADIISMALRGCNIHHGGFIHGNADIISTALRGYNIRHGGFIHGF